MANSSSCSEIVLVTGGCGFLGRRMAEMLRNSGKQVRVLDLMSGDLDRVEYVIGNLCKIDSLLEACQGVSEIYHVASYTELSGPRARFQAINVEGTKNLLSAAAQCGVKRFIYTSSASVVFAGQDIENGKETLPYPEQFLDYYGESKAQAEQIVLQYNGTSGVSTCAIRPHSIFGPGDRHFWPKVIQNALAGKLKFVLGSGQTLSDYTFVDNCVHAHQLAAQKLSTPQGQQIVGGEAYFVSNGEPRNFWGTMKEIAVGIGLDDSNIGRFHIPAKVIYPLAWLVEHGYWAAGLCCRTRGPTLTRFVAANATTSHYFSIEKAKKDLGYEPLLTHEQAMQKTIDYYRGLYKHQVERISNNKMD